MKTIERNKGTRRKAATINALLKGRNMKAAAVTGKIQARKITVAVARYV